MDVVKITDSEIKQIVDSLKDLQIDIEGKKPLKAELALYYLKQVTDINSNLSSAKQIIEKYNDEFSIQLKDLIGNYEVKMTDLQSTASKITDAFQELEKRIDKHDNADASIKSAEDILNQSQEVLRKAEDTKAFLKNGENINKNVDNIILKLQETSNSIQDKDSTLDVFIKKYDNKIEEMVTSQQNLTEKIEENSKKEIKLQEMEKNLLDRETQLLNQEKLISEEKNKLSEKEKIMNENQETI
ncbi:MAG: hypothetical protein ACW99A_11895, partial [Candidatus Kariarchaeaceae archaeon]